MSSHTLAKFSSLQLWSSELIDDSAAAAVSIASAMENIGTVRRLRDNPDLIPNEKERIYLQHLYDMTFDEEEDTCCECGQSVPINWPHEEEMRARYKAILDRCPQ